MRLASALFIVAVSIGTLGACDSVNEQDPDIDAGADASVDADATSADVDSDADDSEPPNFLMENDPKRPCTVETYGVDSAEYLVKTVTYTFNDDGTVATATGEMADGVSGGSEYETTFEYDELGRETRAVSHRTSPQEYVTISESSYVGDTNELDQISYTRGASVDVQQPLQTVTYHYDGRGLIERVEFRAPDGSLVGEDTYAFSETFDTLVVESRGPGGSLTSRVEHRFDENARIEERVYRRVRADGETVQREEFSFDDQGWWEESMVFEGDEAVAKHVTGYACHQ